MVGQVEDKIFWTGKFFAQSEKSDEVMEGDSQGRRQKIIS